MTIKTLRVRKFDIFIYFRDNTVEEINDVDEETTLRIKDTLNMWSGDPDLYISFFIRNMTYHLHMRHYLYSKFIQK